MESDYQHVLEKQRNRFEVLRAIYRDTNGEEYKLSTRGNIKEVTGISDKELVQILEYLQNEGLVKSLRFLDEDSDSISIKILHKGVLEVEAAISRPEESTEHFPAQVFHIINNAPVAGQQFGNQNTLNVTQKSNLVEAAAEIQQLLKQLEQSYPTETFTQKAVVVDEAVKQIESNPGFRNRVVGALKSAGKEAVKEAIDHPLANILMAAIEGWQEG